MRPHGSSPADLEPPRPRAPLPAPGISQVGEVISRLSGLAQEDPEKLKASATDLAAALRQQAVKVAEGSDAAVERAGGAIVQALGRLAGAFDRVAATGDLLSLGPPAPSGSAGYARQPPGPIDVQAMQTAMSFVAARLGVG